MNTKRNNEQEEGLDWKISSALHQQAAQVEVSAETQQRILTEIQKQKGASHMMKPMTKAKKIITAAVAIVALTCTTAIASGNFAITGIIGHNLWNSRVTTVQAAQEKALNKLGISPTLPETFANGFQFKGAGVTEMQSMDEEGNAVGAYYYMLDAVYENKASGEKINFFVDAYPWDEKEMQYTTKRICRDTTVYYDSYVQKLVPPDYRPTAEDEARSAAGSFDLAYGSDKVEENVVQYVCWKADGVKYEIMGHDVSLTVDELFAMAEELLA